MQGKKKRKRVVTKAAREELTRGYSRQRNRCICSVERYDLAIWIYFNSCLSFFTLLFGAFPPTLIFSLKEKSGKKKKKRKRNQHNCFPCIEWQILKLLAVDCQYTCLCWARVIIPSSDEDSLQGKAHTAATASSSFKHLSYSLRDLHSLFQHKSQV